MLFVVCSCHSLHVGRCSVGFRICSIIAACYTLMRWAQFVLVLRFCYALCRCRAHACCADVLWRCMCERLRYGSAAACFCVLATSLCCYVSGMFFSAEHIWHTYTRCPLASDAEADARCLRKLRQGTIGEWRGSSIDES